MLNNSADIRIREVKPLLRTKRKLKAQDEIDKSVSELTFEEMQVPFSLAVGWNHFAKWSLFSNLMKTENYSDLAKDPEGSGFRVK